MRDFEGSYIHQLINQISIKPIIFLNVFTNAYYGSEFKIPLIVLLHKKIRMESKSLKFIFKFCYKADFNHYLNQS